MQRRHLDYPEDARVTELGPAALDDLLDRGDLDEWTELARAVGADPGGVLASTVLGLCEAHAMYGTSSLWRSWIERLRGDRSRRARHTGDRETLSLAEWRRRSRLTQQQVGDRIGMPQSDVSKLERRSDLRLSTLRAYVAATGGSLELIVRSSKGEQETRLRLP